MECAQCHDHKNDPFTQKDYYQLFAYFNNTPLEVKHTSGVTWDFYGPKVELPTDDTARRRRQELQTKLQRLTARQEKLKAKPEKDEARQKKIQERIGSRRTEASRSRAGHHAGDGGNVETTRDVRLGPRRL